MTEEYPQGTPEDAARRAYDDESRGVSGEVLRDLGEPDLDEVAQQSLGGLNTRESATGRFQHGRQIVRGRPHAPPVSREDVEARKAELSDATVPATQSQHSDRPRTIPPDSEVGTLIAQTHQHLKDAVKLTPDERQN
jgi:hypothetical protein